MTPSAARPIRRLRRRRANGYVLIVTLGLLAASATLLVAIGREAVDHALRARLAVNDLQRDWAARSCRATLLARCEQVLKQKEVDGLRPFPLYRATVMLSGRRIELTLADEQAKANVNALLETAGLASAEQRLRAALSGTGLIGSVRLRPAVFDIPGDAEPSSATQASAVPPPPARITGWGQVFDSLSPALLFAPSRSPLDRLTCFGDGSLNVIRATEPSTRLALSPPLTLTEIGRLLSARDAMWKPRAGGTAQPSAPAANANLPLVDQLLTQAKIQTPARARLPLTHLSRCHSLSIVIRDARRSWYYLYVLDASDERRPRVRAFVW
jgi:hypothetical protein